MIKAFWIIGLIVVTFAVFHNTKSCVKLFTRFVFDGADTRVPYIIALFTFNCVIHLEIYYFLFVGIVSSLLIFQIQIYSFVWASCLFWSRLSGYVTMNLTKNLKNNIYIIFTVIFWMTMFLLLLNFNPYVITTPETIKLFSPEHLQQFLNIFTVNYIGKIQIPFFIFSFLMPGALLWFDLNEKRYKYIKINCLFIIPIILKALVIFNFPFDSVIVVFGIFYLLFPTILLEKETKSIIKHSNRIDTRVNQINKIIKEIVKICPQCPGHCVIRNENCKMNRVQRFQIKLIAKMIIDDPGLEDIIMRKHFFNHKKYANVYEKINFAIVSEQERLKTLNYVENH
jgi:hypothetical protein